jgi:hypothetical protein
MVGRSLVAGRYPYRARGAVPAKVPDRIIGELRERERGGVVQLPQLPEAPGLRAGDRVRVLGGPFQGHLGLYAGMRRQHIKAASSSGRRAQTQR